MSWMSEVGKQLKKYTSGGAATAPALDVTEHFDEVLQSAPPNVIAESLAAAFRSGQMPAFGQVLSTLFTNSNGDQKAGLLKQLFSAVGPDVCGQVLSGAGLAGLAGTAATQPTPDQAQAIPPEVVQQLAVHAEKANPSIIDTLSSFYAQHGSLLKTLGGSVLAVVLTKIAERQK